MSDYLDIHALADGQLSGAEKSAAETRLRGCDASQREYQAVGILKDVLQSKCEPIECAETWSKCQVRLKEIERTKRVEGFVGRYAWGLCSIFLVAIVMAGSVNRLGGHGVRTGDVARMAGSMIPLGSPRSQDPDDKRRWLSGVMDGPMPVQPDTLQVVDGAKGRVNGHQMVRLNLMDAQGPMTLFIVADTQRVEDAEHVNEQGIGICPLNGANAVGWADSNFGYILIGSRPFDSLVKIAQEVRATP